MITDAIFSSDRKWRAEISARHGANVTSLKYCGNDVLIPLISEKQLDINPYVQGCPILLPANRTFKGRFSFEGRDYELPLNDPKNNAHLHGLIHSAPFMIIQKGEDNIILEYVSKGEHYPFEFILTVKYALRCDGFYQYYTIKNIGKCNMPYTFALHTTFVEPDIFSVPISLCQQKDEHHIPTGKYVTLSDKEKNYVSGSPSKGLNISGYYKSNGNISVIGKYCYTVSEQFDHWILFNAQGKGGYLCVEPQVGASNGLNMSDGFRIILPGKEEVLHTKIGIL